MLGVCVCVQDVADLTLLFQNGEEGENDGLASKVGAGLDPEVRMRKKATMGEVVPGAVHQSPPVLCHRMLCPCRSGDFLVHVAHRHVVDTHC